MIELTAGVARPPLVVESRLVAAPGVWTADSALNAHGLGAHVTPPLGWSWDGDALPWEATPAGLVGRMARRPIERYLTRLNRTPSALPLIVTLAPDSPSALADAALLAESYGAAAIVLWDATAAALAAVRAAVPLLPLLAEQPCTEAFARADELAASGADALWVGAPRVTAQARLWGAAAFPLVYAALEALHPHALPVVAGAAISSARDATRCLALGAVALALDPSWWIRPSLKADLLEALRAHDA